MSQGRGSAVLATTIMLCLVVLFHFEVAESASYVVGGRGGWTFNVSGWPKGKKFKAGDTLGKHIFQLTNRPLFYRRMFGIQF